jgi:hypothetical protein
MMFNLILKKIHIGICLRRQPKNSHHAELRAKMAGKEEADGTASNFDVFDPQK